jgi:hypothetical protein
MDNSAETLDQADEEILTPTASDEAIEAAAGMAGGQHYTPNTNIPNCSLSPGQCCMEGRSRRGADLFPHAEPELDFGTHLSTRSKCHEG